MPITVPFKWLLPELRGGGRGGGEQRKWGEPHGAARAPAALPPQPAPRPLSSSSREPERLVQGLAARGPQDQVTVLLFGLEGLLPDRAVPIMCPPRYVYTFIFFEPLSAGVRPRPRALRPCRSLREAGVVAAEMFPAPAAAGRVAPVSAMPLGLELCHGVGGTPAQRGGASVTPPSPTRLLPEDASGPVFLPHTPRPPASQGHDACHVVEMREEGKQGLAGGPGALSTASRPGGARGSLSAQPTLVAGGGLILFTFYLGHFKPLRKSRNSTVNLVLLASLVCSIPLPTLCLPCDLEANPRPCSISSVNVAVRVFKKRGQIHF